MQIHSLTDPEYYEGPWTLVGNYRLQAKANGKRKERTVIGSPGGSDRHLFDRRLFLAAALLFPVIVLAGFGRTYYFKVLFATPPLPSTLVHVHGLVMTLWVLLFIAQVRLISSNRIRLHQRTGYAGAALGVLIIATGVPTAIRAAKYGSGSTPADIDPAAFMIVPMFDLLIFAVLFGAAIFYRRRAAAHKSLMLLTAVNFLPPAVARIPIASLQALGPVWFFGLPTVIVLLCLGLDTRRHGRINRVFLAGSILLIASYVVRLSLMTTPAWMSVAGWLTGLV